MAGRDVNAQDEIAMYWRAIGSSVDRLLACLAGLSPDELDWRPPADDANSLAALAVHTMGNVEHRLLAMLCRQDVVRDREAEFRAADTSTEALGERWHTLRTRVDEALAELGEDALDRTVRHPERELATGREVLLVVARHAAEHAGQAELTRDLLRHAAGVA
ncbi:MAG TPA: DinB family protein [Candidatus Dormibacteraeota bacterium]|nr:DinB family protein [Candidatus Dormibacteraeota bacterium]